MNKVKYNLPNRENPIDKICYGCHQSKVLDAFNKCKTGIYGFHNHCRDCQKKVRRAWYEKHREQEIAKNKTPEYKAKASAAHKVRYHNDPTWKNAMLERNRKRRKTEPAKEKARIQRAAWLSIPRNRIAVALRKRMRCALLGIAKTESTEKLLGETFEQFKSRLESLFLPRMTWDNYGEWHIDHIIPCAHFDLSDALQQKICFHYLNFQPLWAKDNISKGDTIFPELYCRTLKAIKRKLSLN